MRAHPERTPDQIAKEFGPPFAKAVFQLRPDAWQGPIESGYGWHLVFVENLEPRRVFTLSLATLGVLHVPRPPVEACIALSILLLASEILRLQRGERSLTSSWPWAVAFAFGFLHGLGFASALIDIGLPQGDVPLALLAFNIGVEVGQLAFIAAVLSAILLAKQFRISAFVEDRLRTVTAYGVGTVAAFWFIERLVGFWV
jgi:HupE / UreJ protein/PPIC-type PPIASE domain